MEKEIREHRNALARYGQSSLGTDKIARWAYKNREELENLGVHLSANSNYFHNIPDTRMVALGYAHTNQIFKELISLGGLISQKEASE